MKIPAAADLQRWSDEVARDATSLAFLPLARAYRRQGRRDAALRLCLKGLEAHPSHVEAHALLALLYLDAGDRDRAADEWSVVLHLDTGNFEALRGLGFCFLEQDELPKARYHLERAALIRPGDAAVQEALRLLRDRIDSEADAAERGEPRPPAPHAPHRHHNVIARQDGARGAGVGSDTDRSAAGVPPALAARAAGAAGAADRSPAAAASRPTPPPPAAPASSSGGAFGAANGTRAFPGDPSSLFDSFLAAGPLLGALVLDDRGLVLAGRLEGDADGEALGAVLGGVIGEAARAVDHLDLGGWHGMLFETEGATVHVAPVASDAIALVAAKRSAPMGWVLRTAAQVGSHARHFLGVAS